MRASPSGPCPRCSRSMGVSVIPGQMQFTRIRSLPRSSARDLVSNAIAPFEAEYAGVPTWPARLAIDPVLRIAPPPPPRMCGTACLTARNDPFTLTAITRSHSASVICSIGFTRRTPALLKRMSIRPQRVAVSSTIRRTSASLETSTSMGNASNPSEQMHRAVSSAPILDRSATPTFAPSRAKAIALARPIPLAAPVTIATFPLSFKGMVSPELYYLCI